jgi:hypothetical protein
MHFSSDANGRGRRRLKMQAAKLSAIEPALVSIKDAAAYTGESDWRVKQLLREGVYKAVKSGRRTLVEFAGVKDRVATLRPAKFAPPRRQKHLADASSRTA